MLLFLDTEFTDLSKDGELISLALVEHENRYCYIEFTDHWQQRLQFLKQHSNPQYQQQAEWVEENVLPTLYKDSIFQTERPPSGSVNTKCSREEGVTVIKEFLSGYPEIELVCDVGHFDMVQFVSLFGHANHDLPKNISPAYWDLNQLMASRQKKSIQEAFDIPRNNNHNALADAIQIWRTWNETEI